MTPLRVVLFASMIAAPACGEDDRNEPAPPGMSGGSVTVGGGGSASGSMTSDPGTSGGPGGPTMPTSASASASGSDTSTDTGGGPADTGPNSMPPTGDDGTTAGAVCTEVGAACEVDGVCVQLIDNNGVSVVCSHGTSGEPCLDGADCVSMICNPDLTGSGLSSTCA